MRQADRATEVAETALAAVAVDRPATVVDLCCGSGALGLALALPLGWLARRASWLRTGLLTARVQADRKVGRSDARELSGVFYTERVPLPPDGRRSHALEILLRQVKQH